MGPAGHPGTLEQDDPNERPVRPTRLAVGLASTTAFALTAHSAWNIRKLRKAPRSKEIPPNIRAIPVAVLVPARDEAAHIAACLTSLLAQDHHAFSIFVLDDDSRDQTRALIKSIADNDPRVTLLTGTSSPPPGWLGKSWACHRLAEAAHASEPTPEFFIFIDADVRMSAQAISRIVALMELSGLDLASPYPGQVAETLAERLIQPLLQWSWLTTLPLGLAERSTRPSLTAANGQILAITSSAYRAISGHRGVRGEVLEDLALARAVKAAGKRASVTDGTDLATCRMYDGAQPLIQGYTKSLWAAFGSPLGATAAAVALSYVYVLPPSAALIARDSRTRTLGFIGYAVAVAGRGLCARRTGGRTADAWTHPLSILALDGLICLSLHRRGQRTLTWKGRPIVAPPPLRSDRGTSSRDRRWHGRNGRCRSVASQGS